MSNPDTTREEQERVSRGQSIANGDTGDGDTGVPAQEPGISNRPGDKGERELVADPDPVIERDEESGIDDEDDEDDPDADAKTSGGLDPDPD